MKFSAANVEIGNGNSTRDEVNFKANIDQSASDSSSSAKMAYSEQVCLLYTSDAADE